MLVPFFSKEKCTLEKFYFRLSFVQLCSIPARYEVFVFFQVLEGFGMDRDQFVDLCILLGCDYVDKIKGIGPKKAIELVKKHKSIEAILENIDQTKYPPPSDWLYTEARYSLFISSVTDPDSTLDPCSATLWIRIRSRYGVWIQTIKKRAFQQKFTILIQNIL